MKICWDNLNKLKYNSKYGFKKITVNNRTYWVESEEPCPTCQEYFLTPNSQKFKYCSKKCSTIGSNNFWFGKKRPDHSEKMKNNNPMEKIHNYGEMNPNWKGGISKLSYCSGWVYLSKEIRECEKTCQNPNCDKRSNRLAVHHIDYNKENCNPNNLITLCHICNAKANGNRTENEKFYAEVKIGKNNSA